MLAVAIPAGLASAVAYGASTAVQHQAVQESAADSGAAGGGLARLVRDPRWWLSIGGDGLGLVLQLLALATGPVVLIQPMFVLCLPVALPIRRRLGGPPVTRRDGVGCAVLVAGLAGFFALTGDPGRGHELATRTVLTVCVLTLVAGAAVTVAALRLPPVPRAVCWSAVAGAGFGVEATLVNVTSRAWDHRHLAAFAHAEGLVPLVGLIVIGGLGFALSMAAFGIGSLSSSFPAMLVVDPLVAVLLGAGLLGEHVALSPARGLGYAACLAAIVAATVGLAADHRRPAPVPAQLT